MSKTTKLAINGILLLNKPIGYTSNFVLQKVKHLFNAQKAGHTGSLDPIATGMLPICFGQATKFSQYLLDADKCYEVTAKLGIKTSTADATGEIISNISPESVTKDQLHTALNAFRGQIKQVPSMYSALKHQGIPLYKYARAGKEVERKARDVTIHKLTLDAFEDYQFKLTVCCSKGTYIRNLVEDIGDMLGVGAHVTQLHRTYTMGLEHDTMYPLEDLQAMEQTELFQLLLPVDRAIEHMPCISLNAQDVLALRHGKVIQTNAHCETGIVRVLDDGQHLVGLGIIDTSSQLKAHRLLAYSSA